MESVQQTLDFVHSQEVKQKQKANSSNSAIFKGEIIQKDKLAALEIKLFKSKQNVVKNLILARKYEKSILQSIEIEKSVKSHMKQKLDDIQHPENKVTVGSNKWLQDKEILLLEKIFYVPSGYGRIIEKSLFNYNDDQLCKELASIPHKIYSDLNESLFTKIARAASGLRITKPEAISMYDNVMNIIKNEENKNNDVAWILLVKILRKKLLILFISESLSKSNTSNNSFNSAINPPLPPISIDTTNKINNKSVLAKMNSTLALKEKLNKSLGRTKKISNDLVSSLSQISQAIPITGTNNEHSMARQFAKRMSARKMEQILFKVAFRAVKEGWDRWNEVNKLGKSELLSKSFMKGLGTFKLLKSLNKVLTSKLIRAMDKFKNNIAWFDSMEYFAAVIEVQRYIRGTLVRFRKWNSIRYHSCVNIQKVTRGHVVKIRIRAILRNKRLRAAVRSIERAWHSLKWDRILKKLFKLQKQGRAATKIERVYRGHVVRSFFRQKNLEKRHLKGALKMQCLVRRYFATIKIDILLDKRHKYRSARKMQSIVRMFIVRLNVKDIAERLWRAKIIQYSWWCYLARKELHRRVRIKCAIKIQKFARGRKGRKRFLYFKTRRDNYATMRLNSIKILTPIFLGYKCRRIWIPKIRAHITKRYNAATTIQKLSSISVSLRLMEEAKLRVAKIRIQREQESKIEFIMNTNIRIIQRVVRGFMGRRRWLAEQTRERNAFRMRTNLPSYYWIREDYYRTQNMFHRSYIIKLQCFVRCCFAFKIVAKKRRIKFCNCIKRKYKDYLNMKEAKKILREKREIMRLKIICAGHMQRISRGFMGRYEARKHHHAEIVKFFIHELKSQGLIGKVFINFRVRKRGLDRANNAAIKIQALGRRFLARLKFQRSYKKLVRDRNNRIRERKTKAVCKIQSIFRMALSKKIVIKRRVIVGAEIKKKLLIEEVESKLDEIHDDWMNDMMAIRIETGLRGKFAKTALSKKEIEVKQEMERRDKIKKDKAVAIIQALIRGVRGRKKYRKMLPMLRKDQQMRSLCIECEKKKAVRRCVQCKDRFCDLCYINFHKKGNRQKHNYEIIRDQVKQEALVMIESTSNNSNYKKEIVEDKIATKKSSKKDWEEFYDKSAKAKYWFNKKSGEASWICPY